MPGADARAPAASSGDSGRDTKHRLLDAAERLFSERGFEGTSMRAVAGEAGTSVSAANYHFGSKRALIETALVRRLEPLNRQRLGALTAVERAAHGAPVAIEALVEAFLRPGFEAGRQAGGNWAAYRQLAAKLYTDSHEALTSVKVELFEPVIRRYIDALARSLPDRSRDELALDFQFLIGVMVHVISGHSHGEQDGVGDHAVPGEDLLRHMVCFTSAGLRAKPTAPAASPPDGEPT